MGISLRPAHLKRYREIAALLFEYGGSDAVRGAGLDEALDGAAPADPAAHESRQKKAASLAGDLERLGPTFIKLGQLLSTRHDLLPPEYIEALSRLQDRVAPFPFADVERIIGEELHLRVSKAFAEIDPQPLASASLGQVHRAVMRDGREVAVKVQRPGIRQQIENDLAALEDIASFLDHHTSAGRAYGFTAMLDEFRKTLYRELDYRKEGDNLLTLAANLEEFELIVVPRPVLGYTTSRVLVMEFVRGTKITKLSPLARTEIDGHELAKELFAAYLKQILADGFFHADPHPGNVFLTVDRKIALLDVGMTGTLTPGLQEQLLRLLLAMSEGRSDDALRILVRIGTVTEGYDERKVAAAVSELVDEYQGHTLSRIQLGRRLMEVARITGAAGLRLPPELTLLARALINLDQVGRILDPSFDPNETIRENAARMLQERLVRTATPGNVLSNVLEAKDFVVRVPGQLNRILETIASNQLRIEVDAFDEDRLMASIHKVANRITIGLVLSALIVGAALLMRVSTPFVILGYPGIAMIFFSVAALGGLALVVSILRD